jgi:hypothetical protein
MTRQKLLVKLGRRGVRHTFVKVRAQLQEDNRKAKWAFIFDQGEFGCNYWRPQ